MNEIERAYHEATEQWKAGFRAGVEAAAGKVASFRTGGPDAETVTYWGEALADSIRSLLNESDQDLVDEDEPDRYVDEIPRSEDERLDNPQYGQAEGLNKLR